MTPDNKIMDYVVGLEKNLLKVKEENEKLKNENIILKVRAATFAETLKGKDMDIYRLKHEINDTRFKLRVARASLSESVNYIRGNSDDSQAELAEFIKESLNHTRF